MELSVMFTKKFLSLLLAAGLAFGFSLNAGATVAVVSQEVLKIFNCENEKELEENFGIAGCVGDINNSLKKLQPLFKLNLKVCNLCKNFSNYCNVLHTSAAKDGKFTNFQQRDAIITEITQVITENETFKKQLDRIINGKTKHESLQYIGNGTSAKEQNADKQAKRRTGFHYSLFQENRKEKRHTGFHG